MCSRIFGLKENEDLDDIFTLDDWDPQPKNIRDSRKVATKQIETLESALQTPMNLEYLQGRNSDSAIGTENSPRIVESTSDQLSVHLSNRSFSEQFFEAHEFSDSAVGTESQSTVADTLPNQLSSSDFLNSTSTANFESQASNLWPSLTQETASQVFLPTQSEMFSQDFASSMDETLDSCMIPTTSNNLASQHSFYNFQTINSDLQRSTQHQSTNNTSLGNLSFYSLMQRSLMKDTLQPSCSSIQLALMTPTATQTDFTQDGAFSQFFTNRNISGNEPTQGCSNLAQDITDASTQLSGTNSDLFRQFDENLRDSQSIRLGSHRQLNEQQVDLESQQYSLNASLLPKSILDLYEQIKSSGLSDWSFVYALSAQTCQEFMPMSYNVTLKTSLLLSIASIDTSSDVSPIPIIAFGRDSTSANSIMNCMGNFAQRFLAPTDHTFNVMVNPNKIVEVGPVFLAKNGVCYLGDWSGLSKRLSDEIKILIDSGRYFLNETSESFQLGSALWTYWSLTKNRKDFSQVAVFMKYFGIPIMTESNESDDILEFLLIEARDGKIPDDVLNISTEDMKNYLNVVRKVKLRKEHKAQQLLKAYSDTIQRDRGGLLSARSFQIIQQMAESFAKLSLRDNVLVCDVVGAISIAEKTFFGITGMARCPLLAPTQDIEQVDQYIQAFHKWIFNYVGML
ncbi:uncharacterized protein LOC119071167 isoform X2 [Bradysia coprophila]|uniref:uncharacterized protein LOC119071167 isoform X2 n=1 Tax=Bradysia coprophila TaxID=38358 RepID=UPI00187D866F|nr:uncharacterized protein LOC119071167 isoform X2 [Bradysia coprophila]